MARQAWHDAIAEFGGNLPATGLIGAAHGRIGEPHHGLEGAAEALLIELEGRFALAVEDQVGIDPHDVLLGTSGFQPQGRVALGVERGGEVLVRDAP
jgi:hypothetical protein